MLRVDKIRSNALHNFLEQEKTHGAASRTGVVCHDHRQVAAPASLTLTIVSHQ